MATQQMATAAESQSIESERSESFPPVTGQVSRKYENETLLDWFLREHRGKLHLLAFVGACTLATPRLPHILIGLPLVALGLVFRAWAAGYITKNHRLCTQGPYAYCRHPMYLGSFVVLVGLCIAANNLYLIAAALLITGLTYYYAIRREEALLHQLFGQKFERYRQRTPALLPRFLSPSRKRLAARRFTWHLANYNGIWEQTVAVLLLLVLFVVKAAWLS